MKNVNQLVLNVQAEGNESYSYIELFETLSSQTIEPKAESFKKQLKGNVDEAISEGYKLMMELVESWDGTGNFHTLFKTSYTNRLKNLVKALGRDKRKHNTSYDVSLSESASSVMNMGEASPIIETLNDSSLVTKFDVTDEEKGLEELLELFAVEYPEQAGCLEVLTSFSSDEKKSVITNALTVYYGVQTYTQCQKKVSRAKESFYKFLSTNRYALNF